VDTSSPTPYYKRLFPKVSDLSNNGGSPRLLLTEFFQPGGTMTAPAINPVNCAHERSQALVVAFTDYSVKAIKINNKLMSDMWVSSGSTLYWGPTNAQGTMNAFVADVEAQH
jgi:hypothetical protein